jgi:UDP-3-O-acyl-N-acetylglucosamine deacetylase
MIRICNHKILDCIGDLYTSGYRIIAECVPQGVII